MRGVAKGMVCSTPGCGAAVRCKGLCNQHYHVLKAERRMKPCACGCGEKTSYIYKHGHHTRLFAPEEQARRGRMNNGDKQRDPPGAVGYRKVAGRHEHRVVMEKAVGRLLGPDDLVHHANRNKRDNRLENLELTTRAEHINEHREELIAGKRKAWNR